MKINLIMMLKCLILGSKRKHDEIDISEINSTSKYYTHETTPSNFSRNPCHSFTASTSSQCNDSFTNLGNYLDISYNYGRLHNYFGDNDNNLEKINEEMKNNATENVFNDNSTNVHEQEECFTLEQFDKFVAEKYEDFNDGSSKPVNEGIIFNEEQMKNNDLAKNSNRGFSHLNLISSEIYTLKSYIEHFIFSNIPESYTDNYERNVKTIAEVCEVFDKYKVLNTNYIFPFSHKFFGDLLNNLKNVISSFGESSSFNRKTCSLFLVNFNAKIYATKYSTSLRWEMDNLSHDYKIIYFYGELMKLYKYVHEIPEILTLGGLFNDCSFRNVVFIMHLINLFAEDVKNIKHYRVFILFMITRAFKSFYSNSFNPFNPDRHEVVCDKGYHDLYFFLWEFNAQRRHDIKRRKNNQFRSESGDFAHLKAILLIYLYQHSIFFKFYNIDSEHVSEFQKFIDKVIESDDCIACFFNEYLGKIKIE